MTWKQKLLAALTVIAGVCTLVGGIDLTQIAPLVPDHVAAWLVLALPAMVTIGKLAVLLGDYADDGVKNDSFKVGLLIGGLFLCLGLSGCVASIDDQGDWSIRTDPRVVDRVLEKVIVIDDKGSK